MRKFIFFLIVLTLSVIFAQNTISKAQEYYYSAEKAYRAQDFRTALFYYELALKEDSRIETDDVMVKYKMGISAFMTGDYNKAKSYLAPYKGNPNVDGLLKSIDTRVKQDEWRSWLSNRVPVTATEMTAPQQTESNDRQFNAIIFVVFLFVITFLVMIFMEYRVFKAKSKIQTVVLKSPEEVKESAVTQTTTPLAVEEESINFKELLPSNSKVVNIEELLNEEIDVFKELLEESKTKSIEEELAEAKKSSEEVLNETGNLLNEIFGETKREEKTVENVSVVSSQIEKEKDLVDMSAVDSSIAEMISKLSEYVEKNRKSDSEFRSVDELEKINSELNNFDDKESISDDDSKIIVQILKNKLNEKLQEANT